MGRQKHWMISLCLLGAFVPLSKAQSQEQNNKLARDIFKQLIEINTTESSGSVTAAAEAMAKRLRDAGFAEGDVMVAGPDERKKNLVARIHGTDKEKPLLLIAHLDVVEARREDWTTDPFQFVERDGYFYGRGTSDVKDGDAILMSTFLRLKREGFVPDRDLILALTADEETATNANGVDWLVKQHRDWIDADYCVNMDAGDFLSSEGKKLFGAVQASEKIYADYTLEVHNDGGHSSLPSRDNAIYHLADGLARVRSFEFPADLNEVTRSMLERTAALHSGQVATDMKAVAQQPPSSGAIARLSSDAFYNALIRTTCVATMLSGGHAPNALPQLARANVNCRIIPGEDPQQIREMLQKVVADPQIKVSLVTMQDSQGRIIHQSTVPPSPLRPDVMNRVEAAVHSMWPGLPIIPSMETGATDGKYLREAGTPTYGVSGVFFERGENRAHGKDERVGVQSFYEAVEFNYRLVKSLSTAQ